MKHTWDNQLVGHRCVYCGAYCVDHDKHDEECLGVMAVSKHYELVASILERIEQSAVKRYEDYRKGKTHFLSFEEAYKEEIAAIKEEMGI